MICPNGDRCDVRPLVHVRNDRGQSAEPLPEDLYLVEEVERLETAEHVALQAEPERHHRHDHGNANDDAHRRQDRAQLRLAEIP